MEYCKVGIRPLTVTSIVGNKRLKNIEMQKSIIIINF